MTTQTSPLMSGTRLFLNALLFVLYAVTAIIAVAAATVLTLLVAQGQSAGFTPDDTVMMLSLLAFLIAAITFFRLLRAVVDSVAKGDPFNRANPERLDRLGWLAMALWLIDLVYLFWQAGPVTGTAAEAEMGAIAADAINHVFGLIGPITLFILARVFRHGVRMREDLEGTV